MLWQLHIQKRRLAECGRPAGRPADRQTDRQIGENSLQFCAFSAEQDKDRRRGVRTLLFKDLLSDSDGTFSLSLHGQAASGVDFVLADTEEHDYIQLTAL